MIFVNHGILNFSKKLYLCTRKNYSLKAVKEALVFDVAIDG